MRVSVDRVYALHGVIDATRGLVGGVFAPDDSQPRTPVIEWDVDLVGRLSFDPETGDPVPVIHGEWADGDGIEYASASVRERAAAGRVGTVPCLWLSGTDTDGVVHTQEFPLEPGEYAYGVLIATVS